MRSVIYTISGLLMSITGTTQTAILLENQAFTLTADPSINSTGATVNAYTWYIGTLKIQELPIAQAVQNGRVTFGHLGLPVGVYSIKVGAKWVANSPTTTPQTGEVFSLPITLTVTANTPVPPPPGMLSTPINLTLEWPNEPPPPPPPPPPPGVVTPVMGPLSAATSSAGSATATVTVNALKDQFILIGVEQVSSGIKTYTVSDASGALWPIAVATNGRTAALATSPRLTADGPVVVTVKASSAINFNVRSIVLTANGVDAPGFSVVGALGDINRTVNCAPAGTVYTQSGFSICLGVLSTTAGMSQYAQIQSTVLFTSLQVAWYAQNGVAGDPVSLAYRRGTCTSCVGLAASVRVW